MNNYDGMPRRKRLLSASCNFLPSMRFEQLQYDWCLMFYFSPCWPSFASFNIYGIYFCYYFIDAISSGKASAKLLSEILHASACIFHFSRRNARRFCLHLKRYCCQHYAAASFLLKTWRICFDEVATISITMPNTGFTTLKDTYFAFAYLRIAIHTSSSMASFFTAYRASPISKYWFCAAQHTKANTSLQWFTFTLRRHL